MAARSAQLGGACEYLAAIGKERELRPHWQRVRELLFQEADVAALSSRLQLAVLKDAKLDVTALSEPIERWMDEPPPGLLSDGKLTNNQQIQQTAMNDRTATARRSDADRKNFPARDCCRHLPCLATIPCRLACCVDSC
jgi:hypothetical protein